MNEKTFSTWSNTMTKLVLILMMVGFWSGCGGDSPTGDGTGKLLTWTANYDDGSVKEEYQYYLNTENNKRMKGGWYNSYYSNGEYWEVGTYTDDRRSGEWSYFTEIGKETKGIYDNGKKDSGEFWIHVKWDDSVGVWLETDDEYWDTDGVFRGLFTYDEGVWNGLGVLYWKNGNKRGEGLYEDGKHEGYYKKFYFSGKVEWEANYKDGKLEGRKVEYDPDGNLFWETNYVDGKTRG
jgi:antitoxin component YwqK of YwqJK toxin-antitoxin module